MLKIYNFVVDIIGQVPPELEFVYAIGTIVILIFILLCIFIPFKIIYGWCE